MKFRVVKDNYATCESCYLGVFDENELKKVLRGYKESVEFKGEYVRKGSSVVYVVDTVINRNER